MQSLQQKASEWSGVSIADAFAIDEANLFHKLGLQTLVNLSTNFYNRVYDDDQEWFRSIFANSDKQNAIQNQIEFLVQRMGGPTLYSQRRGALLIYFISYQPYCFIIKKIMKLASIYCGVFCLMKEIKIAASKF